MAEPDSIQRVTATFEERYGDAPTSVATAPGRVNLLGGHVDYNGGVVLPAAIDRHTVVAARPRDDDRLRVYSLATEEEVSATVGQQPSGWAAYVVGTATVLSDELDHAVGADLLIGGDMVMRAGLSSSASLELAVAGTLNDAYDSGLSPTALAEIGWRAETQEVGMACGIMDQYTSALGRTAHVLRLDCRTREVEYLPFDGESATLLVFDTGVSHQLTDSGYNDRVQECREATARLDERLEKQVQELRDVIPESVEDHAGALGSLRYRRARHVTTEMQRVDTATDALRDGDFHRFGSVMRESHRSLRENYEVSCAELDTVVDILGEFEGVYGCRMTGGGWGGSVVALVEPGVVEAVAAEAERAYRERTGIDGDAYIFGTADGLRVVD